MTTGKNSREMAASLVSDAGGQIIGRTRLQKIAYLLECAGLGEGFQFEYRHYGPFSEDLANGIQMARAFGLVDEDERRTDWGGWYSIFTTQPNSNNGARQEFAKSASKIGAIELELAATAAYLKNAGYSDPWDETKRRKPEKASRERIKAAKKAYKMLTKLDTPAQLPALT